MKNKTILKKNRDLMVLIVVMQLVLIPICFFSMALTLNKLFFYLFGLLTITTTISIFILVDVDLKWQSKLGKR